MYLIKLCGNKTYFEIHLPPGPPCNCIHLLPLPTCVSRVMYVFLHVGVWVIQWYWLIHLSAPEKRLLIYPQPLCSLQHLPTYVQLCVFHVWANSCATDYTLFTYLPTEKMVLRPSTLMKSFILTTFATCVFCIFTTHPQWLTAQFSKQQN